MFMTEAVILTLHPEGSGSDHVRGCIHRSTHTLAELMRALGIGTCPARTKDLESAPDGGRVRIGIHKDCMICY